MVRGRGGREEIKEEQLREREERGEGGDSNRRL